MGFAIDFVVTWVDGSDESWKLKRENYESSKGRSTDSRDNRYRDYGLLKNWFERVWKYAPWVHNVFLVTDNQSPVWAISDERITVVNHDDFIPKKYLPTFNSNAIELNLWRIKNLSEHFVCFNDDMFLTKHVRPEDFFSIEGLPKLNGSIMPVVPRNDFSKIIFNNMVLVNKIFPKSKYFKKNYKKYLSIKKYGFSKSLVSLFSFPYSNWIGFYEDHLPYPNLKSWFIDLNFDYPFVFDTTSKHRFRENTDYSIWLLKYMYIANGYFVPKSKGFGYLMGLNEMSDLKKIINNINKYSVMVIEDSLDVNNADEVLKKLKSIMENNG